MNDYIIEPAKSEDYEKTGKGLQGHSRPCFLLQKGGGIWAERKRASGNWQMA